MRGDVGQRVVSPVRSTSASRKMARAKNAPPVARWQLRQWQIRTLIGSAAARQRTWPQRQPPA